MIGYKLYILLIVSSLHYLTGAGKKHKHDSFYKKAHVRGSIQGKYSKRFHFHSTQNVDDLVKNPTALNNDEASEISKLNNMNDAFLNPGVTSESQDLSRQGLDPYVAMQISKLDHNFQDIFGSKSPNKPFSTARQKGDILPGYGEQYNADGSVSLSNSEWPEYQMKDTPPMTGIRKPGVNEMFLGNSNMPQISPQAGLNPNLLPGQKSDLGMGMGIGMGMDKDPGEPMMSRFVNDASDRKVPDKTLMNAPFAKPGIKNAGFRIPGEFSYKNDRKSAEAEEDANFVKNFMSSKKSVTAKRKATKKEIR